MNTFFEYSLGDSPLHRLNPVIKLTADNHRIFGEQVVLCGGLVELIKKGITTVSEVMRVTKNI